MVSIPYVGEPFAIELRYDGRLAESGFINLYDLSRALAGFERSLALTAHFVLNQNEVITQVPSLRGARIVCRPPEVGSFRIPAYITAISVATYSVGSLESNNPIGHLIYSVYDWVVHEATGQAVDYEESLRATYQRAVEEGTEGFLMPRRSQLESLVEKAESGIADIHRPVVHSGTANTILLRPLLPGGESEEPIELDARTYAQLRYRSRSEDVMRVQGRVTGYNANTFNGRVVTDLEMRPIPFFLTPAGRSPEEVNMIASSLAATIRDRNADDGRLQFDVLRTSSRTGRTTKYSVVRVMPNDETSGSPSISLEADAMLDDSFDDDDVIDEDDV